MELDEWQKEVLEYDGNICLRSGRQVGKSTIIAMKAANFAMKNPKKTVMIIASVERQAFHIFLMVIDYIKTNHPKMILKRPTMTFMELTNGAMIRCLPAGDTGYSIRGYTIHMLIADEAAYIKPDVWTAVTPMLATTKGPMILLSTPHGKEGYFYDCFNDKNFKSWHISSEVCSRISKEFLESAKTRMTKIEYATEFLGEFIDELRQFFSEKEIEKAMCLERVPVISKTNEMVMGVDIARMGSDESSFEIFEMVGKDLLQRENKITKKTMLTDTIREILALESQYKFKRIYIDDGGLGAGVFDHLIEEDETKRKVVAINNASRSLDRDSNKNKKLLKEDLYTNLLRLMQRGEIKFLKDDEIERSLKSIQCEYTEGGQMKIWGSYSHITEGIIRAAWYAKDKPLNIWIDFN